MKNNSHKEQCLYLINKYINKKYSLENHLLILNFLNKVKCFKFILSK